MTTCEYITTAMVAWNEIYQGYPDHWLKVYGNLNAAIEVCDNEATKSEIKKEADLFFDNYKKNIKYRPKFEQLACRAFSLETKNSMFGNVINGMLCYDCAIKHISDASVYYMQLVNNPDDIQAFMMIIGNLNHASDHLVEQHESEANYIREERKRFYMSYLVNVTETYQPNFDEMMNKVFKLAEIL